VTIASQIEQLENLAAIDSALALLEEEQSKEEAGIRQKRERRVDVNTRLTAAREGLVSMERTRGDILAEIRQMTAQIERSREKMARCRNEKESIAVQRELEELRRLIRDREIDSEKLAQLIDQAKADVSSSTAELERLESELGEVEGPTKERTAELNILVNEKRLERKSIATKLKPQTLSRYELIRKRRGTAVASTTTVGTCSACHISIPPMMMQQLKRQEELGQCPQCNRILYFRSTPSMAPPESAKEEP
jgi:predicted  nucleic acid-binding Zn-ribbon protein